jgi:hypothetical protein
MIGRARDGTLRSRGQAWLGALAVTLITAVLAVLDITDRSVRRWWSEHSFTTSVVSGILVLLVTILVVNRVVYVRQLRGRSRAIAAQAAIVMTQAARATRAMVSVLKGDGNREAAADELRTYMTMLLISAPVLIDADISRAFLEEAQTLGGQLARAAASARDGTPSAELGARLDAAADRLRAASEPLLQILDPEERLAVTSEDVGTKAQDALT